MPWNLILSIVSDGLKLISKERADRFKVTWNSLLNSSDDAVNAVFPNYSDYEVIKIEQRKQNFLLAYHTLIQEENKEKNVKVS